MIFFAFIGAVTLETLPVSLFPKSTKPSVRMSVEYDFDLLAFKTELGKKIERSLLNLEKVEKVVGRYDMNRATFLVDFDWDKKPNLAVNEVSAVASFYQTQLPEYLPPIRVDYIDPGIENYVVISSDRYDVKTLSRVLRDRLSPAFNELKGLQHFLVAEVNQDEVAVKIDPLALIHHEISLQKVLAALEHARFDVNLGTIRNSQGSQDLQVVLAHKSDSLDALRSVVVAERGKQLITLHDVATIGLRNGEQDRSFYIGEDDAVAIAAWPKPETDLYAFSAQFKKIVQENVKGIGSVISLNDPLAYINESLKKVTMSVVFGMIFSSIAVLIAFSSLRLTFLVALIMPLSLVCSLVLLKVLGVGLNVVSLTAMSVAIGLVIDSAVVVVDAVVVGVQKKRPTSSSDLAVQIVSAVREVAPAVMASTVTTIVVFLPLTFTQPLIYALVGELATVVVCILLLSVFIALFFLPCLVFSFAVVTGRWDWLGNQKSKTSRLGVRKPYEWALGRLLSSISAQLFLLILAVVSTLVVSVVLFRDVSREIVADPAPNIIDIAVQFASHDYSQQRREDLVKPVRIKVSENYRDDIRYAFTDMRQQVAYISLHLVDYTRAESMISELRKSLKNSAYYSIDVSPWVSAKLAVPNTPHLRVYALGENETVKRERLKALVSKLQVMDEVSDFKYQPNGKLASQLRIDVNKSSIKSLAGNQSFLENEAHLLDYIRYATEDRYLYSMQLNEGEMPLRVGLAKQRVGKATELGNIPVQDNQKILALRHFLQTEESTTWAQYSTRNGEDSHLVEVWLKGSLQDAESAVARTITELGGVTQYLMVDAREEVNRNLSSLLSALAAALGLVTITLLFLNKSLIYTSITLLSIPLGFLGAGLALWLFHSTISVNSLVGLMLLTGLTINNVILITDKHRRYIRGDTNTDAVAIVIRSCGERIRATSVTTFTTVLSLTPIALGLGSNGKIMQPLGISVASGLLLSLLFSLFVTPVLLKYATPVLKKYS